MKLKDCLEESRYQGEGEKKITHLVEMLTDYCFNTSSFVAGEIQERPKGANSEHAPTTFKMPQFKIRIFCSNDLVLEI